MSKSLIVFWVFVLVLSAGFLVPCVWADAELGDAAVAMPVSTGGASRFADLLTSSEGESAVRPVTSAGRAGDTSPVPAIGVEEMISPGDIVRVLMLEDPDVVYEGPVAVGGTVPVPYFGEFVIAGLSQGVASRNLEEALVKDLYQQATVSVTLISRGPGTVYIYGAVRNPGGISIPKYGNLTMLRLILLAQGLSGWAAPEDTFVLRQNHASSKIERISVNLREIFATALPFSEADIVLIDGDIVCVPGLNGELYQFMSQDDREVIVVGEVGSPGIINFGPGELRTVMRAIFKAGSFSQFARKDAVKIIRYERDQSRSELVVDALEIMEKGFLHKDIELQPGDMLIVPAKRINF